MALYCTQEGYRKKELKDQAGRAQVYPVLTGTVERMVTALR